MIWKMAKLRRGGEYSFGIDSLNTYCMEQSIRRNEVDYTVFRGRFRGLQLLFIRF